MASPHEVVTELRRYQVVTDNRQTYNVFAWGQLTDQSTGIALRTGATVVAGLDHCNVRVFDDGFWCVAGDPGRCFEDLTVPNAFDVELSVAGYLDAKIAVNVPANPVWPVNAGSQPMRPVPVRLQGCVTAKLTGLPVAGGNVLAVDPPGPPPAIRPFLLRSPLKQDHTVAATVRGVNLLAVVLAPARELAQDAGAGSKQITVNARTGLVAGQVLQFRDIRSGEYARILTVSTVPANPALPGIVELEAPLQKGFARTSAINVFTAGVAVGPARNVLQPARTGEGLLEINDYPSGDVVHIAEAGLFDEFHAPGAITDAQGYYALDGIVPVDRISVGVEALGFASPPKPQLWTVNYSQAVNVLDFRLI